MPKCSICSHEYLFKINTAVAKGESSRSIASQFGVNYKAVQRHANNCKKETKPASSQKDVPSSRPKSPKRPKVLKFTSKDSVSESKTQKQKSVEKDAKQDAAEFVSSLIGIRSQQDEEFSSFFSVTDEALHWSLEKHLAYARQVIYETFKWSNPETRLKAVDRLHKNIELEAKRTGQFTKDKDNPETIARQKAALENVLTAIVERDNVSRDEALARVVKLKPEAANWIN